MQFAIRSATPAFDYKVFAAATANLGQARRSARSIFPASGEAKAPIAASPVSTPADSCWLASLHLAAARRWLSCGSARAEEVERSLRSIGEACREIDPSNADKLIGNAHRLARDGGIEALLARIGEMLGAASS